MKKSSTPFTDVCALRLSTQKFTTVVRGHSPTIHADAYFRQATLMLRGCILKHGSYVVMGGGMPRPPKLSPRGTGTGVRKCRLAVRGVCHHLPLTTKLSLEQLVVSLDAYPHTVLLTKRWKRNSGGNTSDHRLHANRGPNLTLSSSRSNSFLQTSIRSQGWHFAAQQGCQELRRKRFTFEGALQYIRVILFASGECCRGFYTGFLRQQTISLGFTLELMPFIHSPRWGWRRLATTLKFAESARTPGSNHGGGGRARSYCVVFRLSIGSYT